MIVLCLGTNLGDRLNHLRRTLSLIKKIPQITVKQVSPVYLSDALMLENSPTDWNKPFLNVALRCETSLSPHELLQQIKQIEEKMGRVSMGRWSPRVIDIDILAWDDEIISDELLSIPHKELLHRPFALWPLRDVAPFWKNPNEKDDPQWGSRFSGEAPFHTRQIAQRIDTPKLVGIINVTPDSFSDGGKYTDAEAAITLAKQLMLDGAEILDIGAEATNPRATEISPEQEWIRLEPVLKAILDASNDMIISPKISIDTRHVWVAERALSLGVDWINDVSGLDDPAMCELLREKTCDVVVMHHLGIPVDRNRILSLDKNPVDQVLKWAEKKLDDLLKAGIARERVILDVGIGFGKNPAQCLQLIKHIHAFKKLDTRLLVGHSRKIFLGQFTPRPFEERDIETTVLSLFLASQSVDYLRVHHVEMQARAFRAATALFDQLSDISPEMK